MKGNQNAQPSSKLKKMLYSIVLTCKGIIAVLVPALFGVFLMLGILLFTFDRRRALNAMTQVVGSLGCKLGGIKLDIDQPDELIKQRPCVFIFNHRSSVDPVILCQLLKKDVVGVAKKELRYNPIIAPLLALGETIFVDRGSSMGSIRKALQTLQKGRSIVIAPEGTRSRNQVLRPFKIGAFRIARMGGLPIVPIVIHQADKIAKPGSLAMRSGCVKVDVLPAIDTKRWDEKQLEQHMQEVEQLMRGHLEGAPEFSDVSHGAAEKKLYS